MQRNIHTIDAQDKVLGRLASEVAILLRGKHKTDYEPHIDGGDIVKIENIEKIKVTGKKMDQKIYYSHSGYPGGLKATLLKKLVTQKPQEVLRKAVYNMLPKNKLRQHMMKRLQFIK